MPEAASSVSAPDPASAAAAGAARQSASVDDPGAGPDDLARFDSIWDRLNAAEAPVAAPEHPEAARQSAPEAPAENAAAPAPDAEEGPQYASLDAYLEHAKLDRTAFLGLPVTVKVDGQDRAIPLAELTKGYELREAGHARMAEAARAREAFATEQAQVRQALGLRIQQTESLLQAAQQQMLGDFQRVEWDKLRAENPAEYAALSAEFSQRQQALQNYLSQVSQAKQQEAQRAQAERLQALNASRGKLFDLRPEWRDPAKLAAAQQQMRTAGRQLGFTDAELDQVQDYRQAITLDLAARYLALQASRGSALKRVRAAPQMAPAGARTERTPESATHQLRDAWAKSGFNDEVGAALFERF